MSQCKAYIGDSVYADIDEAGQLVLTTENGYGATNTIVLEPEVLHMLIEYCVHRELIKLEES